MLRGKSGRMMLPDASGVAEQFGVESGIGNGKETLAEAEERLAAEGRGTGRRIAVREAEGTGGCLFGD